MTVKDKQTKKSGTWPTLMDMKRYTAWIGAACFIAAVLVSITATVLMLIGVGCMLLAFEAKVRDVLKRVRKKK
jgi:hypothetical protein